MNLNEIFERLKMVAQSGNPEFANLATFMMESINQVQRGEMSTIEAKEILEDILRQLDIIENQEHLALKEELNTLVNGLISLAGVA